jgi:acetyl esterase/lipase
MDFQKFQPTQRQFRNNDYTNFPPTITFVGDAEPFRDETIQYVNALKEANIPVKFKLYEGCFHGFDQIVSKANISKDAVTFTYDSYAEYYDKYVTE